MQTSASILAFRGSELVSMMGTEPGGYSISRVAGKYWFGSGDELRPLIDALSLPAGIAY